MATLKIALTLTSVDTSSDALSLALTDSLTVTSPSISPSKVTATTTGGNTIIAPGSDPDTVKYTYIKHTGVNSSGAAVTATLAVEDTDNVQIAVLGPGEFMFFPHAKAADKGVQLEASAATIVAEYAYFTKG